MSTEKIEGAPDEGAAPAPPNGSPAVGVERDARLARLEELVDGLCKQVAFLPPQIRQLGGKVDGVATAVSEPRHRALMLGVIGIYDLVSQMERSARAGLGEASPAKSFEVVRLQLEQLLDVNGLRAIEASGAFDPQVHRALSRVPVSDPARDQQIVEVLRTGFRTEQAVLRFAEVSVGHLEAESAAAAVPTPTQTPQA